AAVGTADAPRARRPGGAARPDRTAEGPLHGRCPGRAGLRDLREPACRRPRLAGARAGARMAGAVVGARAVPAGGRGDAGLAAGLAAGAEAPARAACRGGPGMRVLTGYFFRTIAGTTLLLMAVFLSLGAFIEFVSQLDD